MTQSVDVNALFDRLALLVTGGEPGDGGSTLEARVAALESAVSTLVDHRVADRYDINGNTDRIQIIENHLGLNQGDTGGGDTGSESGDPDPDFDGTGGESGG